MSLLSQLLPKQDRKEYFLTLEIGEERTRAAITEIVGTDVTIIGTGISEIASQESETEAIDIAVSLAEKALPEGISVRKTIFILPSSNLSEDQEKIKPERLKSLKKLADELDLKASGFIDYESALAIVLGKEEGSPPTALFIAVEKTHVTYTLLRLGKPQQRVILPKSESTAEGLSEAIPLFHSEILPSRIILYDGAHDLHTKREELMKFPWHKHSTFLHTPKIEIFPQERILSSLVEVAASAFLSELPDVKTAQFEEEIPTKRGKEEPSKESSVLTTEKQKKNLLFQESQNREEDILSADNFGFVKDEDITSTQQVFTQKSSETSIKEKSLKNISIIFSFLFPHLSFIHLDDIKKLIHVRTKNTFIIGTIIIIITITLLTLYIYSYPHTRLSLIVSPKITKQDIDIVFVNESSQSSSNKETIEAKTLAEEVHGEKSTISSGRSKIGEKAKGDVVLYNKTVTGKTFSKGTILLVNNLQFSLDTETYIASASDTGEGLTFGKSTISVTAVNIGPESNIAAGTSFSIKDLPETSYIAKNMQAFTGGTSRDVPSVSKQDQDQLEIKLTDELLNRAKQLIREKLGKREEMLESSLSKTITSKKFSDAIGSEAREVSLVMSMKVSCLTYSYDNLLQLADKSSQNSFEGYKKDASRLSLKVKEIKNDKFGNLEAQVTVTSYFIPDIDIARMSQEIANKSYEELTQILKEKESVAGFRITNETQLPFLQHKLPFSPANLEINVVTN